MNDTALVWFCDLDDDRHDPSVLSAVERARAERLKSARQRRRFVARCAVARHVLATPVGVAPLALEFRDDAHGKPRLAFLPSVSGTHLTRLNFNLSHTENVLALAVAFGREVGIDIEAVRPVVDVLAVAETQFAAEEFGWLRALPARERLVAFYRLWTRKEALAKVDGRGLASRAADEPAADSEWTLDSFELKLGETDIVGALALGDPVATANDPPRLQTC